MSRSDSRKARSEAFFRSKTYSYPHRPRPFRKVRAPREIAPRLHNESELDYHKRRLKGLKAWAAYYTKLTVLKDEIPPGNDVVHASKSDLLTLRSRILQAERKEIAWLRESRAHRLRETRRRARRAYEARHPGRRGSFFLRLLREKTGRKDT